MALRQRFKRALIGDPAEHERAREFRREMDTGLRNWVKNELPGILWRDENPFARLVRMGLALHGAAGIAVMWLASIDAIGPAVLLLAVLMVPLGGVFTPMVACSFLEWGARRLHGHHNHQAVDDQLQAWTARRRDTATGYLVFGALPFYAVIGVLIGLRALFPSGL